MIEHVCGQHCKGDEIDWCSNAICRSAKFSFVLDSFKFRVNRDELPSTSDVQGQQVSVFNRSGLIQLCALLISGVY